MGKPSTVLKLRLGVRTHRSHVDAASLTLETLTARVSATFGDDLPARWALEYEDDEGDRVTLAHAREVEEAVHIQLALGDALVFSIEPRVVPLSQRVAPLLHKLGELSAAVARAAVDGSSRLRHSDVVGRGRASLSSTAGHTRSLLLSARDGVATGLRRAHSAVSTRIERRRSRSSSGDLHSSKSLPDELLWTGESCRSDAWRSSSPVHVEAVDLRPSELEVEAVEVEAEDEEDASIPALVPVQAAEDSEEDAVDVAAYESDADTIGTASCDEDDRDWDIVTPPANASVLLPESSWSR